MSKQIARLLKTDMMGDLDLKSLAQLLRSRGRGNDKILAHITAREGKRLKDEGGSCTINPDTGLPEYDDMGGDVYIGEPAQVAQDMPDLYPGGQLPAQDESTAYYSGGTAPENIPTAATYPAAAAPVATTRSMAAAPAAQIPLGQYGGAPAYPGDIYVPQAAPAGATATKAEKPGFLQSLTTDQMIRLGLGGGLG